MRGKQTTGFQLPALLFSKQVKNSSLMEALHVFKVICVVVVTCVSVQYEIETNINKQRMSSLFTIQHDSRSKDNTQVDR